MATVVPAAPGHWRGQDWPLPLDSTQRGYWQRPRTWACLEEWGGARGPRWDPPLPQAEGAQRPWPGAQFPPGSPELGQGCGVRHAAGQKSAPALPRPWDGSPRSDAQSWDRPGLGAAGTRACCVLCVCLGSTGPCCQHRGHWSAVGGASRQVLAVYAVWSFVSCLFLNK